MICEKCQPRELQAMRALESLTPSGSEFVNDPERCVAFVRDHQASQMRVIVSFKKRVDELQKALEEIRSQISPAWEPTLCSKLDAILHPETV